MTEEAKEGKYKFVYPAHGKHVPYREITRENDLGGRNGYHYYKPEHIDIRVALPAILANSDLDDIQWLPKNPWERQNYVDQYFIQENGGVNLCAGEMRVRGIREGGFRLLEHARDYEFPRAFEPLTWGVGTFREFRTGQDTPFMKCMGEAPLPKIGSRHMKILGRQVLPIGDYDDNNENWIVTPEMFESTNLILADSYGELEQLDRRRGEREFLESYLAHLKKSTEFVKPHLGNEHSSPKGIQYFDKPYVNGWLNHIGLGVWEQPPDSPKGLLERVDFLLENTFIDENPIEVTTDYEHEYLLGEDE
jgi:hypothetical protein